MDEMNFFDDVNFNGGTGNFNIDDVQSDEVINAVFVIDESPSIRRYESEMNAALNDFIQTMQQSHVADNLFVSTVTFTHEIEVASGFQPIANIPVADYKARPGATALYDATKVGLRNALDYRESLELTGVSVKTLLFVITDGDDNSSDYSSATAVKDMHDEIMKKEVNAFGFSSIMFGVGTDSDFEDARNAMGIQHLAKVGTTGKEMRKMIDLISSSVSSASAGQPIDLSF